LYTSGIDSTPIAALCSTDVLVLATCKNYNDSRKVVVCSAHIPYNSADPPPSTETGEIPPGKQLGLVLGCDANSLFDVWGSSDVNPRGRALLEYLGCTDLNFLSKGDQPPFLTETQQDVIFLPVDGGGVRCRRNRRYRITGTSSLAL
jgi:hypothetical protein